MVVVSLFLKQLTILLSSQEKLEIFKKWFAIKQTYIDPHKASELVLCADLEQMQLSAKEKKKQSIKEVRQSLPIYAYREDLLQAVEEHQVRCVRLVYVM